MFLYIFIYMFFMSRVMKLENVPVVTIKRKPHLTRLIIYSPAKYFTGDVM